MGKASLKIKAPAKTRRSKDTHINFGIMLFTRVDEHWDANSVVWTMNKGLLRVYGTKALKKLDFIDRAPTLTKREASKIDKALMREIVRLYEAEQALHLKDSHLLDLVCGWLLIQVVSEKLKIPTKGGILLGAIYNNKDESTPLTAEYASEDLPAEVDSRATKMLKIISDLTLRTQYN